MSLSFPRCCSSKEHNLWINILVIILHFRCTVANVEKRKLPRFPVAALHDYTNEMNHLSEP